MKTIIVKEHQHGSVEVIRNVPDEVSAGELVERWQKASIYYQVRGRLPSCTWRVASSNNMVDSMIEGAAL